MGPEQFSDFSYHIANRLGEKVQEYNDYGYYLEGKNAERNFYNCLELLEAIYSGLEPSDQSVFDEEIQTVIAGSEVDLGIAWEPPVFFRSGAKLLDERLVNESLRWLDESKYDSVRKPFEKGLSHYLEATNKPERLADAVTDMYEATEALARIVLGNDKRMSANTEAFVKKLRVSNHYQRLLKEYAEYSHEFRHADKQNRPRPELSEPEVEAFIYLTGIFVRLAIRVTQKA